MGVRILRKYSRGPISKWGVEFIEHLSPVLVWWANLNGVAPVLEVSHHRPIWFLLMRSIIFLDILVAALSCFCACVGSRIMSRTLLIRSWSKRSLVVVQSWPILVSEASRDTLLAADEIFLDYKGKRTDFGVLAQINVFVRSGDWVDLGTKRTVWIKGADNSPTGRSEDLTKEGLLTGVFAFRLRISFRTNSIQV